MGTITGTTLINKVGFILFDTNNEKWARTELLGWINDGQRVILTLDPKASNHEMAMAMVAGTRQNIPADGWTLIEVKRNMSTTTTPGDTPGPAVRIVDRKILDAFNPNWHMSTQVAQVQNVVFDKMDRTAFWVNPPSDGTGYLWISYAQVLADLSTEASTISLNDIYGTVLQDYMLYRACMKRAEYAPREDAPKYWAAFTAALGATVEAEDMSDPNNAIHPPAMPEPAA